MLNKILSYRKTQQQNPPKKMAGFFAYAKKIQ